MSRTKKRVLFLIVVVVIYLEVGIVFPFLRKPKITAETKKILDKQRLGTTVTGERARIISGNEEALDDRIRLINSAEKRVILSTFDFGSDISGKEMLSALTAAADRGVDVRIVVDGFCGLRNFRRNPYFYALTRYSNAEIRLYNPINLLLPWKSMGRMHDKYLIVDDKSYILGGRNTYDFFLGKGNGHINYDWDILVVCSEAEDKESSLDNLYSYFESVWDSKACKEFGKKKIHFTRKNAVEKASEELKNIYFSMKESHPERFEKTDGYDGTVPVQKIGLWTNPIGIYAKEPKVFYQMANLFKQSKEEVTFHTPYIMCDRWMLDELTDICGKDAKVTMMTNSVANNGNPFGAMDYYRNRDKILATGVNVLEYDGGVSYHGKCFAMDQKIVGVGSFNWDMRSAYIDTEMMLVVESEELYRQMRTEMERYERDAIQVISKEKQVIPAHMIPQKIPLLKKVIMFIIWFLIGWVRFLM